MCFQNSNFSWFFFSRKWSILHFSVTALLVYNFKYCLVFKLKKIIKKSVIYSKLSGPECIWCNSLGTICVVHRIIFILQISVSISSFESFIRSTFLKRNVSELHRVWILLNIYTLLQLDSIKKLTEVRVSMIFFTIFASTILHKIGFSMQLKVGNISWVLMFVAKRFFWARFWMSC